MAASRKKKPVAAVAAVPAPPKRRVPVEYLFYLKAANQAVKLAEETLRANQMTARVVELEARLLAGLPMNARFDDTTGEEL